MNRQKGIALLVTVLAAGALTAIAASGWLSVPDGIVSDAFYQRQRVTDGEIVVVGMDQRALDLLGPMPWPRSVMADAVAYLNAEPDEQPAVIGIDVLYVGESDDPAADRYLAEAASEGNVVTAGAAAFGPQLVRREDGTFYMDERAVLSWDRPYEALARETTVGHINAMSDSDGVLRHALAWVDVPGLGQVPAFSRQVYRLWCAAKGVAAEENIPADAEGFFYLPFSALPGGYYDSVSIADLLDGSVDSSYFSGKIVLIGPYAAGMQDQYITAADHAAPMYGIEIQANAIDALRRGNIPREAGLTVQLWAVFLVCAAAIWLFRDRHVSLLAALWLAGCGLWFGLCELLLRRGWVLHVLWLPLFLTVIFITEIAVNYLRAQQEKRRVTETFGRYVDHAVMNRLLEKGSDALELGGTMHEIAVLFVDIRGFTTMSEALDPPTVVEIINLYLTLTTECIMRYHGTLDKFVGDCTMAFWNAPLPQEDAAYLACCAAMDMVKGSKALGQELLRRFGRTVDFGIGVNLGPAVVGNIGAPMRMDYTAIGDTVNTSARLEANAPGGKILISRAVADALGDRAKVTSLGGSIKLKGKAEGFEILTLDELEY